jgi:uncharacterized protein (DUF58 family)
MARVSLLPAERRNPDRSATQGAAELAARLPRIVLEARRVAAALAHGIHGRRRAGPGESFWQFRPYSAGEAAARIDWRRSARDERLYVRQREWEASQSVWLWIDRSPSMGFASSLAMAPKVERALVLGLALADVLVESGERVGHLGILPPRASRRIIDQLAEAIAADARTLTQSTPPAQPLPPLNEAVIVSDFLSKPDEISAWVAALAARGARGHLLAIADPVEETFPFSGQAELSEPEDGLRLRIGDAAAWAGDYRARLASHRDALAAIARRHGWTLTLHRTDRPASEGLLRIVSLIAAARGGTGAPAMRANAEAE